MKNKITVIVVTHKTKKKIIYRCLKSINRKIKILLIENSDRFKDREFIIKKFKNVNIFCSGSNLGYGNGNNYGLKKIKTPYALILNPDASCEKNFFKKLNKVIKEANNFHLIGCSNSLNQKEFPAGYFDKLENIEFKKNIKSNKTKSLIKVDWVKGYSLIVNMKKFKNSNIFDKNYFLYLEEIDLCKSIKNKSGNIYFSKDLIIKHLGAKGSTARSDKEKIDADNLRNWHYMWSSFYFYKKNYNYFFALVQLGGRLIRSFLKTIFYSITFHKKKRNKYLYRLLGLTSSILGLKSYFRIEKIK